MIIKVVFLLSLTSVIKFLVKYLRKMIKLSNMAEQLPVGQFLRAHKSYTINLVHVTHTKGSRVMPGDTEVPVSGTYKQHLLDITKKIT